MLINLNHTKDEDCQRYIVMGECQMCGVVHDGDPCSECHAQAFHKPSCSQYENEEKGDKPCVE